MKKTLFLVLILFLTYCDFESNLENCRSELFTYDIATCKSAWRSTVCYAVDLDSDKILKEIIFNLEIFRIFCILLPIRPWTDMVFFMKYLGKSQCILVTNCRRHFSDSICRSC